MKVFFKMFTKGLNKSPIASIIQEKLSINMAGIRLIKELAK